MQYTDMVIEAFDAELERTANKGRIGRFKVRVERSPAGEMSLEQATLVEYDDKDLQVALRKLEGRTLDQAGLVTLGRTLAMLLLPPQAEGDAISPRELFRTSLQLVGPDAGLRLRLRLPLQLAVLPWEYAYADRAGGGDGMDGFLALDPRVSIVRHEALAASANVPLVEGDLKLVVALASAGGPPLDLAQERANLEDALDGQPGITPIFLDDATLDEVQQQIPGAAGFHFAGHGVFTRDMAAVPGTYTGVGSLALDDGEIPAERLGINLRGNGVRLAVLGGCETGRRDGVNVWSGIAPALVKAEVPAVVANQYAILDASAVAFSRQFYQALVGGLSIERAVAAGRIAAYNADPNGRDWGVPVLYMRAGDGRLFSGAADGGVRRQAQTDAEADVRLRVKEVAAGGEVLGAEVREMLSGRLAVRLTVTGTVYGKVTGAKFGRLGGGNTRIDMDVDTVGPGGRVSGGKFDVIG